MTPEQLTEEARARARAHLAKMRETHKDNPLVLGLMDAIDQTMIDLWLGGFRTGWDASKADTAIRQATNRQN